MTIITTEELKKVPRGGLSNRPALGSQPYTSTFPADQNPINEDSSWLPRTAADWTNVKTEGGLCYGTNGITNDYDDSYAILDGDWGADYELQGTVVRNASINTGFTHEIELNVRAKQTGTTITLYECLLGHGGGVEMYRWDAGAMSDTGRFSALLASGTHSGGAQTNDVFKVRIQGTTFTAWVNDVQICQATGLSTGTHTTGNPCVGFFTRTGGNSAHLALTDITVTKL